MATHGPKDAEYGEVVLNGKELLVWNSERWLNISTILTRLDVLEERMLELERRFTK